MPVGSPVPGRRRVGYLAVVVKDHARQRALERFPGFKAARIVDEVHEALLDGRVSATRPDWCQGQAFDGALYAWTADECRVYGMMVGAEVLAVRTVLYGRCE